MVLEADSVVGGISRTARADGWRFDIGGHRFFTKVAAGRGALARDPRRRRVPAAAPHEPHLLPGQVLRLPDQAAQRPAQPGRHRGHPVHGLLPWVQVRPPKDQDDPRGLHRRRLRLAALQPLLQDLQREAVGGAGRRRSRPTSRPSASRACRCSTPCGSRSGPGCSAGATRPARSPASSRSSSTPSTGPGMMWERCRDLVEAGGRRGGHGDAGHGASATTSGRATAVVADGRRGAEPSTRPTT